MLNCVDVLAGDESFVGLRKKRPMHRTLERSRPRPRSSIEELAEPDQEQPRTRPRSGSSQAQKAFDKQVDQVKSHTDWDERTKEIQLANLQDVAQRRLDVEKQTIEDEKLNQIREGKADSEQKIRAIENSVRFVAAAIPPLPPLILGLIVFISRLRRENLGANPKPAGVDVGSGEWIDGNDRSMLGSTCEELTFASGCSPASRLSSHCKRDQTCRWQ